jgi:hypothetical protein
MIRIRVFLSSGMCRFGFPRIRRRENHSNGNRCADD